MHSHSPSHINNLHRPPSVFSSIFTSSNNSSTSNSSSSPISNNNTSTTNTSSTPRNSSSSITTRNSGMVHLPNSPPALRHLLLSSTSHRSFKPRQ
eukprot:m.330949 g.330949  ORF g.330949 m.330949 type:complete len:95 (+) comp55614_c0_seq7:2872-3156(+)